MTKYRYDGTDPGLPGGWIHEDDSPCPDYLAPADGTRWWCSEHQQHLKRPGEPCEQCGGFCTNGAECTISQFLGKRQDWRVHHVTGGTPAARN